MMMSLWHDGKQVSLLMLVVLNRLQHQTAALQVPRDPVYCFHLFHLQLVVQSSPSCLLSPAPHPAPTPRPAAPHSASVLLKSSTSTHPHQTESASASCFSVSGFLLPWRYKARCSGWWWETCQCWHWLVRKKLCRRRGGWFTANHQGTGSEQLWVSD